MDEIKRILYRFEADAAHLNGELDKLKSKGQESHGWFSGFKELNEHVNEGIEKLAHLTLAFEGIHKVVEFSIDAIKEWGKDLRLEAATAGISIEELSEAFNGLMDEGSLREFAARTSHGALKLTQQQMEELAKGAIALRDTLGVDLADAMHKLEDAAVSGRMRGLHELGIEVQEGNSRFETTKNLLAEVNKKVAESHGPMSTAADDVDRMSAQYKNMAKESKAFWANLSTQIVEESHLMDQEWLHRQERLEAYRQFTDAVDKAGGISYKASLIQLARGYVGGANQIKESQTIEMPDMNVARSDADRARLAQDAATRQALATLHGATYESGNAASIGPGPNESRAFELMHGYSAQGFKGLGVAAQSIGYDDKSLQRLIESNSQLEHFGEIYKGVYDRINQDKKERTFLQSIGLDKPDAMDLAMDMLKRFGSAWQQTLRAIGEGTEDTAQIFKKFLGTMVAGVGDKLAAFSAAEFVESAANFAAENYVGGASHAAAGALYAGGAVAAYAAAAKLGSDATAAPSAPSASGASAGAGGSRSGSGSGTGGGQGERIVVYAGDSWGYDSPRMRQLYFERAMSEAMKTTAGSSR